MGNGTESTVATAQSRQSISALDRKWRAVVGLSKVHEQLYHYRIFLAYGLCAALTTAITTALTPTTVNRTENYALRIPSANYGTFINETSHSCAGTAVTNATKHNLSASSEFLQWALPNGSWFYSTWEGSWCPQTQAIALASGINSRNPAEYAYVDSGVAVNSTAIGAPATIYTGQEFQNVSSEYGIFLQQTTQCVPVMTSNPVRCETGGKVEVVITSGNITTPDTTTVNGVALYLESLFDPNNNYTTQPFTSRDPRKDAVMAKRMFATGSPGEVGGIAMVFGALTDAQGEVTWAADLARAINDPDPNAGTAPHANYSVTCTMDTRNAYDYRWVTLQQRSTKETLASGYPFYLSGGDECTPLNPTISNILFATAATANWNLVMENFGLDGYFSTIHRAAGQNRAGPYAFPNSRNAMEDVLGLVSAMVTANLGIADGTVVADAVGTAGEGQVVIQATRLGNGSLYVLLLLVPPAYCAVALGLLLWKSYKNHWIPGGTAYRGLSRKQRPKFYAGESVGELLSIRRYNGFSAQDVPLLLSKP